jgi:hypothetical protein
MVDIINGRNIAERVRRLGGRCSLVALGLMHSDFDALEIAVRRANEQGYIVCHEKVINSTTVIHSVKKIATRQSV